MENIHAASSKQFQKVSGPRTAAFCFHSAAVSQVLYHQNWQPKAGNVQISPRLCSAISNVGGIRRSPACQVNAAMPDNQSIRRQFARLAASHPQKKIFLCGLTAPSPIFIFSREGINLTAKWSPTNTTHFKAAGTALEKPAGFKHFSFIPVFSRRRIPFPWRFTQLAVNPKIKTCLLMFQLNVSAHLKVGSAA